MRDSKLPTSNVKTLTKPGQDDEEKKKIIIDKSFRKASIRGLIHVVPVLVSILLISLNLKHTYIGASLGKEKWRGAYSLASFQVAAKLQELMAIASMTKVVFEIIRHQLLYRKGVPLRLVSAGFIISNMPSFFSRSLWTWFWTGSAKCQRAFILLPILVIAVLCLIMGPASAVLMIPRAGDRVFYTPQIWLNGEADDLFPTTLTAAHVGGSIGVCAQPNSFANENCTSRAFLTMKALLDNNANPFHWEWVFWAEGTMFRRQINVYQHIERWARSPHLATGYAQNLLWWDDDWWNKFPIQRTSTVQSKASNVRTACLWQNVTVQTKQIQFPRLKLYETYRYDSNISMEVPLDTWSQDDASFVDPDTVRTIWIDGAQDYEAVTAGLVILAPLISPDDTTRSALVCSIDARWANSRHVQADGLLNIAITADVMSQRYDNGEGSGFLPDTTSNWKSMKATKEWLRALTPTTLYYFPTLNATRNVSTIASLLMSTNHAQIVPIDILDNGYIDEPYQFWEFVVATYFAEGAARVGYSKQQEGPLFVQRPNSAGSDGCNYYIVVPQRSVNICPGSRPQGLDEVKLSLDGRFVGVYQYAASEWTDFASIATLSLYVCIALTHLLYILIRQRSSSAFERPEDMLAIAHSSRSEPDILANTCAGIKSRRIRARNVRILVRQRTGQANPSTDEGDVELGDQFLVEEEQVQIVIGDKTSDEKLSQVQAGVKYGKMD